MESVVARKAKVKHPAEDKGYSMSFEEDLQAGELLTSITSVTISGPPEDETPLTAGTGSVNGATIEDDDGNPIAAGLAAQFALSAGTAGADYRVTVIAATNMNPAVAGVGVVQVRSGVPNQG